MSPWNKTQLVCFKRQDPFLVLNHLNVIWFLSDLEMTAHHLMGLVRLGRWYYWRYWMFALSLTINKLLGHYNSGQKWRERIELLIESLLQVKCNLQYQSNYIQKTWQISPNNSFIRTTLIWRNDCIGKIVKQIEYNLMISIVFQFKFSYLELLLKIFSPKIVTWWLQYVLKC